MMNLHDSARSSLCACGACHSPPALSRRQFLCTTAASVATISAVAATAGGTAYAQQPSGATTPGRAILIKGGCVLSLDRAVGDFEQADVLVEGKRISAVRPNISAPNAEVIDASNTIVMPGFVDTHRHMWQGFLRNVLPDGSLEDYRNVVQRCLQGHHLPHILGTITQLQQPMDPQPAAFILEHRPNRLACNLLCGPRRICIHQQVFDYWPLRDSHLVRLHNRSIGEQHAEGRAQPNRSICRNIFYLDSKPLLTWRTSHRNRMIAQQQATRCSLGHCLTAIESKKTLC